MVAVISVGEHKDVHFFNLEKLGRGEECRFLLQGSNLHDQLRVMISEHSSVLGAPNYEDSAIIAKHNERIVAVAAYNITDWNKAGHINYVYVDKAYRRKGIHSKMVELAAKECAARGCRVMVRTTTPNNTSMIDAIKKQGGVLSSMEFIQPIPANLIEKPKQL